ncbi:MAG: hypothetical protein A3F54_03900 [Candidatus Kerfeldbacteria bacterium RIFCSPHIGHO2_12_FULL_48_17]|uniref:Uncharacterized protein n=1 Tax=Candidatus Kerfeldbacteria bacterium RIFCSPHIGHO2_12_FULL_48_17 TaxID=1798542 RepID=A0A1G2B6I1_9BACT|nr:MAG: hypothetical protein A3F54_03900 [Candidatus Kerfeldbacteria bacterium RIFCSPHIGHO2_12_FULL_48_17]
MLSDVIVVSLFGGTLIYGAGIGNVINGNGRGFPLISIGILFLLFGWLEIRFFSQQLGLFDDRLLFIVREIAFWTLIIAIPAAAVARRIYRRILADEELLSTSKPRVRVQPRGVRGKSKIF